VSVVGGESSTVDGFELGGRICPFRADQASTGSRQCAHPRCARTASSPPDPFRLRHPDATRPQSPFGSKPLCGNQVASLAVRQNFPVLISALVSAAISTGKQPQDGCSPGRGLRYLKRYILESCLRCNQDTKMYEHATCGEIIEAPLVANQENGCLAWLLGGYVRIGQTGPVVHWRNVPAGTPFGVPAYNCVPHEPLAQPDFPTCLQNCQWKTSGQGSRLLPLYSHPALTAGARICRKH